MHIQDKFKTLAPSMHGRLLTHLVPIITLQLENAVESISSHPLKTIEQPLQTNLAPTSPLQDTFLCLHVRWPSSSLPTNI